MSGSYFADAGQSRKIMVIEEYTGPDPKVVPLVFERETNGWSLAVPDAVVTTYLAHLASGS